MTLPMTVPALLDVFLLPPPIDRAAWRQGLALQFLGGFGVGMLLGLYLGAGVIKLGLLA